jgi:hypothetical protein
MRIKLSEKYQTEREDICNKLINILQLGEDKTFLLCDLDADTEKQNKILEMKEEIQKHLRALLYRRLNLISNANAHI